VVHDCMVVFRKKSLSNSVLHLSLKEANLFSMSDPLEFLCHKSLN
jgi:hypothetical protein